MAQRTPSFPRWAWSWLLAATLLVAGAALFSSGAPRDAQAQDTGTVIRIVPETQVVAAGSAVVVDVMVENAPRFAAYEFILSFSPNVLSYVSVTNGDAFVGSTGRDTLCLGPIPEHLPNAIIRYACASTGAQPGPSGDGRLATVTFSTSCEATSELAFVPLVGPDFFVEPVALSDELGASISVRSENGSVIVIDGSRCPSDTALPGDVNCSNSVNSIDAALILQQNAGLLRSLPCPENADVDGSGSVNSIDSLLILQFTALLIGQLPP